MHGNVWEWCQDDWVNNYYDTPRDGKEYRNNSSSLKVLRDGAWNHYAYISRSSNRDWGPSTSLDDISGFRLLRTLP